MNWFVPGYDAEDIAQEKLLALVEAGALDAPRSLQRTIEARRLIDLIRREGYRRPRTLPLAGSEGSEGSYDAVEVQMELRDLLDRIALLPRTERRALIGMMLGFTIRELGSSGAVSSYLARARRKLSA